MVKLFSRAIAALTLIIASGVFWAPTAHASATYPIGFTGIGIYPRSAPDMNSSLVGAALADGTPVSIACEAKGT
jgi:hypothetical protein